MPSTPMLDGGAPPSTGSFRPVAVAAFSCCLLILATGSAWSQDQLARLKSLEEMQWGVRAFHSGLFRNAALSLERAISLDPSNLEARQWLGRTLFRSGLEQEALREWDFVLQAGGGGAQLASVAEVVRSRRSVARIIQPGERYVLVSELASTGRRDPPLGKPTSVRPTRDGGFYVVPYTGTQILRMDSNFRIVQIVRGGLQGFNRPFDVLPMRDGSLFVSEYGANRIARCSAAGDKVAVIGASGLEPGKLLGPQYLAEDGLGYLYVSEYGNRRVSKFDLDGAFVALIGVRSLEFPGLEEPTGLAVQDSRLYVADRRRGVLQVFDLSGNYLGSIGRFTQPEGVHAIGDGRLLVARQGGIDVLDTRTEALEPLADPFPRTGRLLGLATDANGEVLAADFDAGRVLLFGRSESLYAGLFVQIERVSADRFPEVVVDVSVTERSGRPVLGLKLENFNVSEDFRPVKGVEMPLDASPRRPLYAMLLVERSAAMQPYAQELGETVERLHQQLGGSASMGLVLAGRQASLAVEAPGTRLVLKQAAAEGEYTPQWRWDQGLRLAASQLVTSRARRALVFLTTGDLGGGAERQYSLAELRNYLRNNQIAFHVLQLGDGVLDQDLRYLTEETGGSATRARDPQATRPLVEALSAWTPPLYTLRYRSASNADFGRAYISLQVDVTHQRRTGRDELGYFAPRQF